MNLLEVPSSLLIIGRMPRETGRQHLKIPLAVPGKKAYRRLRSYLDLATDPFIKPASGMRTPSRDSTWPAFRVVLKSRQFRASPKSFAFIQFGIGGQMIRFHPTAASAGEHEFRISKSSGLAYLTEPRTGRTWVSTLEPFRSARRSGREASAIGISAPFADLDSARWCAPRLAHVAKWLKAKHLALPAPSRDGKPLPVVLCGTVVAGLHIIDPVTGKRLVTLRSHSLHSGSAYLTVQKESLQLTQEGKVVYYPVKDLLARWENQLTRNAIYASAEDARQRASELQTHRTLGRLVALTLGASHEPDADLLARLDDFNNVAEIVCSDRRGSISLAVTLPKKFGGQRKLSFRLQDFAPRSHFRPTLCWAAHQGLMVMWTAVDGAVAAFGVSPHKVRRIGVFQSADKARHTARLHPSTLIREAFIRKRERDPGNDLWHRVAQFNRADMGLKADKFRVPLTNIFTDITLQFAMPTSRGKWSPKILLSPRGALCAMFTNGSARRPAWRVYGPLANDRSQPQPQYPIAEGYGRPTLENLADLLSKQLSVRVISVDTEVGTGATLDYIHDILRRAIPHGIGNGRVTEPRMQERTFYEFALALRNDIASADGACRREAIVAAEFFYFGKTSEEILNFHAPLFKPRSRDWPAVLGDDGDADIRAREMLRSLSAIIFERPQQGLPATLQSRFAKFQKAMIQLSVAHEGIHHPG